MCIISGYKKIFYLEPVGDMMCIMFYIVKVLLRFGNVFERISNTENKILNNIKFTVIYYIYIRKLYITKHMFLPSTIKFVHVKMSQKNS